MEGPVETCLNESIDDGLSFLEMELETLQSIYINELEVNIEENFTTVSIDLHPATADKLDEQYVRMTLQFILKEEYPKEIPEIKIRNPRGLSDEKLLCVEKDLIAIAEEKRGSSMLFEMIDAAKEHLTIGNRPSGECAICLYRFSDNDVFTKTKCYHYFHSHCLARYARNFLENSKDDEADAKSKCISNELLCPMCRIPIQFNGIDDDYPPPEESDDKGFELTDEMLELQRKMADLYQKQVEQGGIIDVEAEKNKYLLEISNVPTRTSNEEKPEQKLTTDGESCSADSKVEATEEVDSPTREKKEPVRDRNQRFDYRGRNRNFNRPNENRGNYRPDFRYNKRSHDSYRGNYNKTRYGKHNSAGSHRRFEESDLPHDGVHDSTEPCDLRESEGATQDVHDNVSENSEQASLDSRSKHNSDFSPRYNRGPRRGGNNYGYYNNNRRFNKSNYRDRNSSQTSHQSSAMHGDEPSANLDERYEKDVRAFDDSDRRPNYRSVNLEERDEKDVRAFDDSDRRPNYRSGGFKRDEDYNSRQRYNDGRNSQRGNKGAYGRRDNYSQPHNNYSRNTKYGDSRDRDQYHTDRDRNFRGRRNYRDGKYQASGDNAYDGYNKHGAKNYTGNRPGRYSDRSYTESSNNESESVELSSQSTNQKSFVERETGSKRYPESSEKEGASLPKKDASSAEKCPDKLTVSVPTLEKSGSNVLPSSSKEISHASSRTVKPPPGFANPLKKVIYGLQGANPPPGFNKS